MATNIKSVREIRDESDRHEQTLILDLTIIGKYVRRFAVSALHFVT